MLRPTPRSVSPPGRVPAPARRCSAMGQEGVSTTQFGTARDGGHGRACSCPSPTPPVPLPQPSCPKSSVNFFTLRRSSTLTVGRVVASERSMSACNTGGWARGSDQARARDRAPHGSGAPLPHGSSTDDRWELPGRPKALSCHPALLWGAQESRGVDWAFVSIPGIHSPAWPLVWSMNTAKWPGQSCGGDTYHADSGLQQLVTGHFHPGHLDGPRVTGRAWRQEIVHYGTGGGAGGAADLHRARGTWHSRAQGGGTAAVAPTQDHPGPWLPPLTFLKCVADCTLRTGCIRASRTMMLMSAPE